MKKRYIDLMEKTLSAYTDTHIRDYFARVCNDGLSEHGFPRLTVNIGVLIAHGRRRDLLPLFCEMMEYCCRTIPRVKAANDFSVREVVCCIMELERSGAVESARIARWKGYLATIDPLTCYDQYATDPAQDVRNWALFTGVSEYFRQLLGVCDSQAFIDLQIASQLKFFDENGMYMDHKGTEVHHPIQYDLVPRGLLCLLMHFGYRGPHAARIDDILRRAGLRTLDMQSVTGEMAFGGRSNQFLHNEAWLALVLEYEANRYARQGDAAQAARCKAAVARAIEVIETWLAQQPIPHIKNRFPTESRYGCEKYAYFDKYMITTASFLYAAYLVCDDGISAEGAPAQEPVAWQTSRHFHKVFLRYGAYAAEYDTNGDPEYDAGGLGRIHRRGAPSAICLSLPCPARPHYSVGGESPMAMSLCAGVNVSGELHLACDEGAEHTLTRCETDSAGAHAALVCRLPDGGAVRTAIDLDGCGVRITARADAGARVVHTLPALCFDGACAPRIAADAHTLTVTYGGWVCRYTTDGTVRDTGRVAYNRNGHYRVFVAEGDGEITVCVRIERA